MNQNKNMFFNRPKYKKVNIIQYKGYEIPIYSDGDKKYAGHPQKEGVDVEENDIYNIEDIYALKNGIFLINKHGDDVDTEPFFPTPIGKIKIVKSKKIEENKIMKIQITESQYNSLMLEQDTWVQKAASGRQKCGKDARWGGYGDDKSGGGSDGSMSDKQLKKYNKSLYGELLKSQGGNDYQQRLDNLLKNSNINSVPGSIDINQKFSIIYNITNKLSNNKDWFFNNFVKKELNLSPQSVITDMNMLDFVKKKGGFDGFKNYYLSNVL
jgi:hypothetical protein